MYKNIGNMKIFTLEMLFLLNRLTFWGYVIYNIMEFGITEEKP